MSAGMVPYPWPKDSIVSDMLSRMLSSPESVPLLDIPRGTTVMELPFLKQSLNVLEEACDCLSCDKNSSPSEWPPIQCREELLIGEISTFALHVLVPSLFESPQKILVHSFDYLMYPQWGPADSVRQIMQNGQPTSCSLEHVLSTALILVDHSVCPENGWVMSCQWGQAVYPRLFETQNPFEEGYLTLCWAPGVLRYGSVAYPHGVDHDDLSNLEVQEKKGCEMVSIPHDSFPNQSLVWKVAPGDDTHHIQIATHDPDSANLAPINTLTGLVSSLILPQCGHDVNAALDGPDPLTRYETYLTGLNPPDMDDDTQVINMVPMHSDNGLRTYAIAAYTSCGPIVLKKDACMACCLAFARKIQSRVIIC